MFKKHICNRIFDLLKQIREEEHHGLLIVFSDLKNVLARGAYPIGVDKELFQGFEEICSIKDDNAKENLKKIGEDGAILINKKGIVYSPSTYLNVNLFSVKEEKIEPEFCARHISALATSSSTKSYVYTLSEETNKVREFVKGKIKRKHPEKEQEEILEVIKKDIKEEKLE